MPVDPEKLAKLQKSVRIGGKGTPRRKVKKTHRSTEGDDKKLQAALKKLNVQAIPGIEEVNFFKEDGNVLHFNRAQVQASVPSNTFAIYGNPEEKDLGELVPGIFNQMGPESLDALRKIAEQLQASGAIPGDAGAAKEAEDDDIPELVAGETFDERVD